MLAPDDQLVTFEDFELGAPGWQGGRYDRSDPAFGGMLGRFGGTGGREEVSRTYPVDAEARYAMVSFDLHAIDDWALEDVIVFANGVEVLRQNFSTRPDLRATQRSLIADLPWIEARIVPGPETGTERGFAAGGEAEFDQTLHVTLTLVGPPDALRIGFGSTLPDAGTDGASWAIDNFQIITSVRPPED
ncbi:hypothetical protein HKCCE2091_11790 [Rhodobacterales bacterium HKCCE2091]|nr:hypothetical protein [Rhodobacterales bacterium HKCCE2091]